MLEQICLEIKQSSYFKNQLTQFQNQKQKNVNCSQSTIGRQEQLPSCQQFYPIHTQFKSTVKITKNCPFMVFIYCNQKNYMKFKTITDKYFPLQNNLVKCAIILKNSQPIVDQNGQLCLKYKGSSQILTKSFGNYDFLSSQYEYEGKNIKRILKDSQVQYIICVQLEFLLSTKKFNMQNSAISIVDELFLGYYAQNKQSIDVLYKAQIVSKQQMIQQKSQKSNKKYTSNSIRQQNQYDLKVVINDKNRPGIINLADFSKIKQNLLESYNSFRRQSPRKSHFDQTSNSQNHKKNPQHYLTMWKGYFVINLSKINQSNYQFQSQQIQSQVLQKLQINQPHWNPFQNREQIDKKLICFYKPLHNIFKNNKSIKQMCGIDDQKE